MSTVTAVRQDGDVATDEDPHGLKALADDLDITQREIARRLDIEPNTVSRAMSTDKPSKTRSRIEAMLRRMLDERSGAAPGGSVLDEIVQGKRVSDVRIRYSGTGNSQQVTALLFRQGLSAEEREEEIRQWRELHGDPE